MIVRVAGEHDRPGFLDLAGQVEHWFGPMVDDSGFRAAVDRHICRAAALVAVAVDEAGLLGGLLFGASPPVYQVRWLVVSEQVRRRACMEHRLTIYPEMMNCRAGTGQS